MSLAKFRAVLLDMNGTFMFGEDRFGPGEDFGATYRTVGGGALADGDVDRLIRSCYSLMADDYENPDKYDDFPQVAEALRRIAPALGDGEIDRLAHVFGLHELGRVPDAHAAFLRRRLAKTHELGLVANVWAGKGLWLDELERAGVLGLFKAVVFSSDTRSVKPSPVLFDLALRPLGVGKSGAVFVGDSLRCDIEGAKAFGLATVWINPARTAHPAADFVVADLLEFDAGS